MSVTYIIFVVYLGMENIIKYKTSEELISNNIVNDNAIVYEARHGIKPVIFIDLLALTGFTRDELASYLNCNSRTILRYINSNKDLDAFIAEHALGLKSLYHIGIQVFEDINLFRIWLNKANFGLGNLKPSELLKTPGGLRLVKEELFRIEYGATA